jgi:tetratricopeptide (TPR) repeat protein
MRRANRFGIGGYGDSGAVSRMGVFILLLMGLILIVGPLRFPLVLAAGSIGLLQAAPPQTDAFQNGLIALKENRLDAALEDFTRAESERPTEGRVRNFRGIALMRLGRSTEATAEFREAIHLDPRSGDAYRSLGFLEWSENNLAEARANLEKALAISPDDSFAHYYLGRVLLDQGDDGKSLEQLEQSRKLWPEDAAFLIRVASGEMKFDREKDARTTLHRAAGVTLAAPQSARVAAMLVDVHENAAAVTLLRAIVEQLGPGASRWAQFDIALARLSGGEFAAAITEADRYMKSFPPGENAAEVAAAWSVIGIARARENQTDEAIDAFREAVRLESRVEEYWLNLTRELMDLRRFPDGVAAAQDALAANPKSYALQLRLGAAYLSAGRYPEAENAFRELVVAGDPLPTSYVGLAQVLLRTGRADEAVTILRNAEEKIGVNFLISYFEGIALDRAGRLPDAVAAYQKALELNPKSAEAHFGLGKTQLALGHFKEAIAELGESLQLNPGSKPARRLLSQAFRRAGDEAKSAKFAEASDEEPREAESELLGDFILPDWKLPAGDSKAN